MPKTCVNKDYSTFIHRSRYARWLDVEKRREVLEESIDRYLTFFSDRIPHKYRKELIRDLREGIVGMEFFGSMRAMQTAGEALDKDNIAGYNCSYIAINDQRAFDEAMYISMCGTGVGFSVERQYVNQLPTVAENFYPSDITLKIRDSKIGWATGLKELIALLYTGMIPKWDLSELRPAGARLKTFGGRSSGPGPLDELYKFTVAVFQEAKGRRLTSIECHDLMCKIATCVEAGGVRRSAMISLSNLSDDRMRAAKIGMFWDKNPQRNQANNSAVYTEKPEMGIFMKEWMSLYDSKSGERGIFNREAATIQAKRTGRRKTEGIEFGTNPCGEIILRDMGVCNLSEVIVRPDDNLETLKRKVKYAAILGTLQATLVDFRYLRRGWKKNAQEEALLGVSFTGIYDNKLTSNPTEAFLTTLKQVAIDTNKEWAERLDISPSAAITCIKPSGNLSQLTDTSSGIHPRYSRYYIRSVRNSKKDPISDLLKALNIPNESDVTKPDVQDIFYFPIESPAKSVTRKDVTALDQLELYLKYRLYWCEHNPSCTVYVRDGEWLDVAAWVYNHFNEIGGISFLPYSDHIYKQAPYTEITEEEYIKLRDSFPAIEWTRLSEFEKEDQTNPLAEPACSAGQCEI